MDRKYFANFSHNRFPNKFISLIRFSTFRRFPLFNTIVFANLPIIISFRVFATWFTSAPTGCTLSLNNAAIIYIANARFISRFDDKRSSFLLACFLLEIRETAQHLHFWIFRCVYWNIIIIKTNRYNRHHLKSCNAFMINGL